MGLPFALIFMHLSETVVHFRKKNVYIVVKLIVFYYSIRWCVFQYQNTLRHLKKLKKCPKNGHSFTVVISHSDIFFMHVLLNISITADKQLSKRKKYCNFVSLNKFSTYTHPSLCNRRSQINFQSSITEFHLIQFLCNRRLHFVC